MFLCWDPHILPPRMLANWSCLTFFLGQTSGPISKTYPEQRTTWLISCQVGISQKGRGNPRTPQKKYPTKIIKIMNKNITNKNHSDKPLDPTPKNDFRSNKIITVRWNLRLVDSEFVELRKNLMWHLGYFAATQTACGLCLFGKVVISCIFYI